MESALPAQRTSVNINEKSHIHLQARRDAFNLSPGFLDYRERVSVLFIVERNGIVKLRGSLATFKIKLSIC